MIYVVIITWVTLQILITVLACLFVMLIYKFVGEKLQIYYEDWRIKKRNQRLEKEREEYVQWKRKLRIEQELRRKEREKYPLFYWRELCSESVNEHMKQRKENI